jgi:hypothetical protein
MPYRSLSRLLEESQRLAEEPQQRSVVVSVGDFKYIVTWSPNSSAWLVYTGTSGQAGQAHKVTYKSFAEAFEAVGKTLAPSFPNPVSAPAPAPEEEDPGDRQVRKAAQRAQRPGSGLTRA